MTDGTTLAVGRTKGKPRFPALFMTLPFKILVLDDDEPMMDVEDWGGFRFLELLVDLGDVSYIDSCGVGLLIAVASLYLISSALESVSASMVAFGAAWMIENTTP